MRHIFLLLPIAFAALLGSCATPTESAPRDINLAGTLGLSEVAVISFDRSSLANYQYLYQHQYRYKYQYLYFNQYEIPVVNGICEILDHDDYRVFRGEVRSVRLPPGDYNVAICLSEKWTQLHVDRGMTYRFSMKTVMDNKAIQTDYVQEPTLPVGGAQR